MNKPFNDTEEGTLLEARASMATIVMAACMVLQVIAQILIWIALL